MFRLSIDEVDMACSFFEPLILLYPYDILRTIIMNWLSEKGYLDKGGKIAGAKKVKRDLAEEIDLLDTMLTSLVEVLEEKGIASQQEWEKRIKERVKIE